MDAKNPNILLAGTWQVEQHTWVQCSGGPGSGVYLTKDGGAKWTKLTTGMPKSAVRQDRRADRAVGQQAHVCADPDRGPGIGVALG